MKELATLIGNSIMEIAQLVEEFAEDLNPGIVPSRVTLGSHKRLWWRCANGHVWDAVVSNRSKGSQCPQCSREMLLLKGSGVIASSARHMEEFAADLNVGIDPHRITLGSNVKIWWRCRKGHEWQASPNGRKSSGCRKCAFVSSSMERRNRSSSRKTVSSVPELLDSWSKSNEESSRVVLVSSKDKFAWECGNGHVTFRTPAGQMRLKQCPFCSGVQASPFLNLSIQKPDLAKDWSHKNNKMASEVLATSNYKAIWFSEECGHEWTREVYVRSRGQGCPYCFGILADPLKSLLVLRPDLVIEWDFGLNAFGPESVSLGSNKVVNWRCSYSHLWKSSVASRALNGSQCPECGFAGKRSMREIRIACELSAVIPFFASNPCRVRGASGKIWEVDFVATELGIAVEYDGGRYHSLDGYLERDLRKTLDIMGSGYRMIRVREAPLEPITENDIVCNYWDSIKVVTDKLLISILPVVDGRVDKRRVESYLQGKTLWGSELAVNKIMVLREKRKK